MKTKVLFICLDGTDGDLLLEWGKEGLLPNLQSIIDKGNFALTKDPIAINGSHWPTFLSGISPVKHGRYWARQIQPGTYEIDNFNFEWQPFWQALSDGGLKVGLINPPEAPLAKNLNGIQIVERHNYKQRKSSFEIYPSVLKQEIIKLFGDEAIGSLRTTGRTSKELKDFRENLMNSVEKTTNIARYFLNKNDYDFFLMAFREAHWAGHECWHLHDRKHPEYDQKIVNKIGNPIKDIYQKIDQKIGEILQDIDSETIVFIFASTSIEANYSGIHLLDDILLRLENPSKNKTSNIKNSFINTIKQFSFIRKVKREIFTKKNINTQKSGQNISYKSHRQCFQVPSSEAYGAIRFNVIDREPNGKIPLGKEYDLFCEQLVEDLSAIVNVESGEKIIKNIYTGKEIYQGEKPMGCPDVLVEWNRNAPISSVTSPKIGTINKVYRDSRTGDHKSGGFVSVYGDSPALNNLEKANSIIDFAPMILSLFNLKIMDK